MKPLDFFIFDIESSGLYKKEYVAYNKNQAWIVQIAGIRANYKFEILDIFSHIVKPPFKEAKIEEGAFNAHGITLKQCISKGIAPWKLHDILKPVYNGEVILVAHNLNFDAKFLHRYPKTETERANLIKAHHNGICTMKSTVDFCKLSATKSMKASALKYKKKYKNWKPQKYKSPKLEELYEILFDKSFNGAHDALNDTNATFKCLKKLVNTGIIKI